MGQAVLLVGHGTRNPLGQQQFLRLAEALRTAVAPMPVEVAYIELQSPTIEEALVALHLRGLKSVVLSPALLFAAGHAKQDIPAAVAAAVQRCPGLEVRQAEALGLHEAVLELAAIRLTAAFKLGILEHDIPEPALVYVGRGSSDFGAIEQCGQFAVELATRHGLDLYFVGFLAIAPPSLPVALSQAELSEAGAVIVQPHLLFDGEMLESTAAAVAHIRRSSAKTWIEAAHLGSDLLQDNGAAAEYLVRALIDRIRAADC